MPEVMKIHIIAFSHGLNQSEFKGKRHRMICVDFIFCTDANEIIN